MNHSVPTAGVSWGRGDGLCVFSASADSSMTSISVLSGGSVSSSIRKLVNEGHGVFSLLHGQVDTQQQDVQAPVDVLVQSSRYYRALIGDHIDSLAGSDPMTAAIEREKRMFHVCDLLWSLYETFFLSSSASVARPLSDWVQRHFSRLHDPSQLERVMAAPQPETSSDYWNFLYSAVLTGAMDKAAFILDRHAGRPSSTTSPGGFQSDIVSVTITLIRSLPPAPRSSTKMSDYIENFNAWQARCREVLTNHTDLVRWPQLQIVLGILSGDSEVIASHTRTWQEQLVSEILYNHPTFTIYDVYDKATSLCQGRTGISKAIDENILAIMALDAEKAINLTMIEVSSPWVLAHLTDLLHLAGHLQQYTVDDGLTLREYFCLEFVDSLMNIQSLWQVCIAYLSQCGSRGRAVLSEIIERQPVDSERQAFKLLNVCETHGFQDQARLVCLLMGTKDLRRHRYGSCCYWLLRSHDASRLATISSNVLGDYVKHGSLSDLEAVADILGTSQSTLSAEVSFLTKFRDLQVALHAGHLGGAAKLVLELLSPRGGAPKRFWFDLLFLSIPLLEDAELRFNSQQTYLLMDRLQDTLSSHVAGTYLHHVSKSQVDTVRLALARNLSRAVMASS